MKRSCSISLLLLLLIIPDILYCKIQTKAQEVSEKNITSEDLDQIIENLDFKDTDIRDVIRSIATKYDLNIFIDNSISVKVTLHLSGVRVIDVIRFLVDQNNLRLVEIGNIIKILPQEIPPPPPKEIIVEYNKDRLSVDFDNEDIEEALRVIAKKSGKTILLDKYAKGRISGLLQDVPFESGLSQLLENNGFYLDKKNKIYIVHPSESPFNEGEGKPIGLKGGFYLQVEDSLISMDLHDAPLNRLVEEAARKLDQDVFIYGTIEGNISARVEQLTFQEMLNFIFQGSNYTYKIQDGVYLIGDKSVKGISSSQLIKLNYLKTDNIMNFLPQSLTSNVELSIITEQNGIMVIGTNNVINDLKNYIAQIDKPSPQILIETLVIDFNTSKLRDISVQAGYSKNNVRDTTRVDQLLPGLDILFSSKALNTYIDKAGNFLGIAKIGKLPEDFFLHVKALESKGLAKVRSKPHIATLNGYPADISIGQTQYYKLVSKTPIRDPSQIYISETEKFETIEANVSLKITPWVSASGEITTEIHPEFRQPVGGFSPEIPPTIASRTLNSTVRLRDGETIVLGGLIQNSIDEKTEGLPIVKDFPIIGALFQSKNYIQTSSELVIYVTPRLYYFNE